VPKRILVVDDDPEFLQELTERLQAQGFDVAPADGYQAALAAFGRARPDLAIVDLMLEHRDDGFMLCHHIKKADPAIPVILVTAVTYETGMAFDAAGEEERRWLKADVMLDKPVRFEAIQREIDRLLPRLA